MHITFYGAAQNVTGSKHVIESDGFRVLLDCGLYQGKRQEAYALNQSLPFDVATIDAMILSHGHADHCGMIPMLVKQGFANKIFATPATADIARLIMLDSAKVQEEDYRRYLEREVPGITVLPPLYSNDDVEHACEHFESVPYVRTSSAWHALGAGCRFKFYDAGHILGSAITVLELSERGRTKRIAFTGDLGNTQVPILREPEVPAESIETLILECTYGSKNHPPLAEVGAKLSAIIKDVVEHKRKIIVPAFALGRTQELLYVLHLLYDRGQIPAIPVYLDSPLAIDITAVFEHHTDDFDQETWVDFMSKHESPFSFKNLKLAHSVEESKALNQLNGPCMIIASSGMAEGGRIVHHIEHTISDPNAIIMLTGYQAEHTLGRRLQDGVTPVRIFDKQYTVQARIMTISEFSAHADQAGLLSYVSRIQGLKNIFLVHTELPQATAFQKIVNDRFPALAVTIPSAGQSCDM